MGNPPGPANRRERRDPGTLRALRSATLDLALERGLATVSVDEIAARAGVPASTFFDYFEEKEDAALLGVPGITAEELDRLAYPRPARGLWAEITELCTAGVKRAELDVDDLERLLLVQERDPALVTRQFSLLTRFEVALSDVVARRLGDAPSTRMRAELTAGAAMTAVRVGMYHWSADEQKRPAHVHVEAALTVLPQVIADVT